MSASEMVAVVDRENRVTGATTRAAMRAQGLIHRASYILVFDRHGRLFISRRTLTKDIYPGYWDVAAGGVVLAGESYEESARRELAEELGSHAPLTLLFDHFHDGDDNKVWGRVFSCVDDGPFTLQAEEVVEGRFMDPAAVLAQAATLPLTPDGIDILARYLATTTT